MSAIILIFLVVILFLLLIIVFLLKFSKNDSQVIKDEDILKLKLGFSDEFSKLSEKLNASNDKVSNQLLNFKQQTNESIIKSGKDNIDSIFNFNNKLRTELKNDFLNLTTVVETRLDKINERVELKLEKSFEDTKKTFSNVMQSLGRLDEAQKKMEFLSNNVQNLNNVLTDKKTRGIFGEVQLYQVLNSAFGENSDIYKKQFKLSNGTVADAVLFAPEPVGTICIDSKFPLENYRRLFDESENKSESEKLFEQNLKKHIDDISSKYIIKNETTDQAILFLPAEAIFAYLNAYNSKIVEYAYSKRVWITSPTTMMAILTTVQAVSQNLKQSQYALEIQKELNSLSTEFDRYAKRWETLEKDINKVSKDVKDIFTTSTKITKRFDSIKNVDGLMELQEENKNCD
ncbi:MAG: DNA recombination protein RmuC [Peptoniphilaceae bacterium]|uniref:DNA recombination protein RmuC n=1 Tax=Parvimonas sp. TaxID=1944660 RepID=UPI0025DB7020|nr:DNA recombination protein RmuC [Parvimonas sp.]MCI5996623.1 DNA recombination protein RmuC [Parvimonas sp.]MDD7765253.1 DNA recombination protein RmuC [Peptoniphilaceae bacterium]MDY3051335.1 DNA recombination protein RmuC [Parvimonas sp.]